jgi:hypothetical protein
VDLGFVVVEERVRAQNWLGFDEFFDGYLIKKVRGVLGLALGLRKKKNI